MCPLAVGAPVHGADVVEPELLEERTARHQAARVPEGARPCRPRDGWSAVEGGTGGTPSDPPPSIFFTLF